MAEGLTGSFLGYDPGGKNGNGLALIQVIAGRIEKEATLLETHDTANEVLRRCGHFLGQNASDPDLSVLGIGLDTLTFWSGDTAGWRQADLCLRRTYARTNAQSSIMAPSGLMGSMALNGMFVLTKLRESHPDLYVTETHPKVLYWAMTSQKYMAQPSKEVRKWAGQEWSAWLDHKTRRWLRPLGLDERPPSNPHELDALISAYAAFMGRSRAWRWNLRSARDCQQVVASLGQPTEGEETGEHDWAEDSQSLHCPPGVEVEYRWPDADWIGRFKSRTVAGAASSRK